MAEGVTNTPSALPLLRLEDLGEALLDFGQMSDLIGWLDADQIDRVS